MESRGIAVLFVGPSALDGVGVRHMPRPPGMNSHQIISDGLYEVSHKPMSL